jgi:chorismate synthase
MGALNWTTAGESHGSALVGILTGLPAGLSLSVERIDRELARRQRGYGRSARQAIEHDRIEVLGVRDRRSVRRSRCDS